MKLKYKGIHNLSSVQKSFKANDAETTYEVSDVDGKYLLKTFPKLFEEIKEIKEVKETKPKTQTIKSTKDTKSKSTKTTKTTRTRKAKVEVEEKSE